MLSRLLLLLILFPLIDLLVLLWIAQQTSAALAFGLVLAGGVAGAAVMRWQGLNAWRSVRREIDAGQTPAAALFDSLLIFVAGLLLLTPGILTDIAGIALLLPSGRRAVRGYLRRRVTLSHYSGGNGDSTPVRDTIIESRVIESRVISSGENEPERSQDEPSS